MAQTAGKLKEYLKFYQVSSWASQALGGSEVDFKQLNKALNWAQAYALCFGCE